MKTYAVNYLVMTSTQIILLILATCYQNNTTFSFSTSRPITRNSISKNKGNFYIAIHFLKSLIRSENKKRQLIISAQFKNKKQKHTGI